MDGVRLVSVIKTKHAHLYCRFNVKKKSFTVSWILSKDQTLTRKIKIPLFLTYFNIPLSRVVKIGQFYDTVGYSEQFLEATITTEISRNWEVQCEKLHAQEVTVLGNQCTCLTFCNVVQSNYSQAAFNHFFQRVYLL